MIRKLLLGLLITLVPLAACDGDSTGTSANITGTYNLRTVNGAPVPVVVPVPDIDLFEITGGVIVLNADMTFSARLDLKATNDGTAITLSEPGTGTYTRSGSTLTMTSGEEDPQTATISGNRITLDSGDGFIFVFEK